jgi:SRSO17 transposase
MSKRLPAIPAPGLLEQFSAAFDPLFSKLNQRDAFRQYLANLLLPAERNKTLTALANTEPILEAHHPRVQKLQWFLSESTWDAKKINQCRLSLLRTDPTTATTTTGVLVIDETGDRKAGSKTAHVGRQYLANLGKIDNGVVSVTSLWADERLYYPLEVEPYTPAQWFDQGKADPTFRTKPQIALELVEQAATAKLPFRAVVADSLYGEHDGFRAGLHKLKIAFVMALKPSHAWWHPADELGSLQDIAAAAPWQGASQPGRWVAVTRTFRDGHTETWWALEVIAGPYGPDQSHRGIVVTTDPKMLPETSSWYLISNLPAPNSERAKTAGIRAASLEEIVRLYGLRMWVEQSYKQVKRALGWADYQVRGDQAIQRHWSLVCCAFTICWWYASHTAACSEFSKVSHDGFESVEMPSEASSEKKTVGRQRPSISWPVALRQVRARLVPWIMLRRYWRAWSKCSPPLALQQLLESLWLGNGINIYNSS